MDVRTSARAASMRSGRSSARRAFPSFRPVGAETQRKRPSSTNRNVDDDGGGERSGSGLPAGNGPGLPAHTRGRSGDRQADRDRAARSGSRGDPIASERARDCRPRRAAQGAQDRAQEGGRWSRCRRSRSHSRGAAEALLPEGQPDPPTRRRRYEAPRVDQQFSHQQKHAPAIAGRSRRTLRPNGRSPL